MRATLSKLNKNTVLLGTGFGLAIGIVLRLVTQPSSSLFFTLAVGFSVGFIPLATLVVVGVSLILNLPDSSERPEKGLGYFKLIVMLIYIIFIGGTAGLFGLSLAVLMLVLDIITGWPFASQPGWLLSGALYGAIWGLIVIVWFMLRSGSKPQA